MGCDILSCDICDARTTMRARRVERGMTVDGAAKALQISQRLYDEIEAGGFTHPKIALRIQEMFGLTDFEVQQLVSPNHVDDVLKHQINLRSDDFTKKRYTERETEYFSYKDQKFGKNRPGRRSI